MGHDSVEVARIVGFVVVVVVIIIALTIFAVVQIMHSCDHCGKKHSDHKPCGHCGKSHCDLKPCIQFNNTPDNNQSSVEDKRDNGDHSS